MTLDLLLYTVGILAIGIFIGRRSRSLRGSLQPVTPVLRGASRIGLVGSRIVEWRRG